jgi:hypothetical protein
MVSAATFVTMTTAATEFAALVDRAREDPNIVGLMLAGSRGTGAYVTPESDYDAYVILRDDGLLADYGKRFPSEHGDPVEYILFSLEGFRSHATPGTSSRWNAYTFAHIEPLVDKLDGEISRIASAKALPGPGDAREFLDGYLNQHYRSKKNLTAGRELEGHLDAAESVPWFLDFLFAAHDRVRPFNKWLRWELEHYPLEEPWRAGLLTRLETIVSTGSLEGQRNLFCDAEASPARAGSAMSSTHGGLTSPSCARDASLLGRIATRPMHRWMAARTFPISGHHRTGIPRTACRTRFRRSFVALDAKRALR